MGIEVVIFDADHTLYDIDTSYAYDDMFRYLAKALREEKSVIERAWREHVKNILNSKDARNPEKRRREYSLYVLLGQFNITDDRRVEEITENALEIFWSGVLESITPKEGVMDILKQLKDEFALCIASDEFLEFLEWKLDSTLPGWRDIFTLVITPEQTGTMKPSRKYYSIVLKKFGVKPESCVVVGDSWKRDLKPAMELGLKTVLLSEKKEGKPDAMIESFGELQSVIKGL